MTPKEELREALEPCPFCGSTAVSLRQAQDRWALCSSCHAEGPKGLSESVAITAWNTRLARAAEGVGADSEAQVEVVSEAIRAKQIGVKMPNSDFVFVDVKDAARAALRAMLAAAPGDRASRHEPPMARGGR